MTRRKISRRSFLKTALAGGALAGTASLTITKDLFAQASGPILIGHHCDLTGVISSWGVWHDKAAKAAVEVINKGGGIVGRKVELVTEDTESNPAPGARKLRNLIQRGNAEFIVGSVHSGVMLAALPIASELKTIYFSTGEATEVTGSKGTRFSFRTGTDTYSIAAASMPWCVENFGKVWTIILPTTPGARARTRNPSCSSRKPAALCAPAFRCRSTPRTSCPTSRKSLPSRRWCCQPSSAHYRSPSTLRPRPWGSTRR